MCVCVCKYIYNYTIMQFDYLVFTCICFQFREKGGWKTAQSMVSMAISIVYPTFMRLYTLYMPVYNAVEAVITPPSLPPPPPPPPSSLQVLLLLRRCPDPRLRRCWAQVRSSSEWTLEPSEPQLCMSKPFLIYSHFTHLSSSLLCCGCHHC